MVEFIEYKGEKHPISVDFYALKQVEKEGLDLEKDGIRAMERLFWHSLIAGHFHEDKELTLKEEHLDFLFGFLFSQFRPLMTLFLQSLKEEEEEKPKKQTVKERLKKAPKKQA